MKAVFTGVLLFLWAGGNAQKVCNPNLDSVKMIMRTDFISLIDTMEALSFSAKSNKGNIPKFIRRTLSCWGKGKFRIVNPGKRHNNSDAMLGNRPTRQLTYLGANKNFLLLSYHHGGFGSHSHILIFNYSNKTIKHLWNIQGIANSKSKEEIISQLIYIKENRFFHINYSEF